MSRHIVPPKRLKERDLEEQLDSLRSFLGSMKDVDSEAVECPRCHKVYNPHEDKGARYAEFVDGILCGECCTIVRRVTGEEP